MGRTPKGEIAVTDGGASRRAHHHRLGRGRRDPRGARRLARYPDQGGFVPGHRRRPCRRGRDPRGPGARAAGRSGGVGGSCRPGAARAPPRHLHPGRSARRDPRIHRRPGRVHRQRGDRARRAPGARDRGGAGARHALAWRRRRCRPSACACRPEHRRAPRRSAPPSAAGRCRTGASSPPSAARISMPRPRRFWRGCRTSMRS